MYSRGRPSRYYPHENQGSVPPQAPGEYTIYDEKQEKAYIGETNNLFRRMNEHIQNGKIKHGNAFDFMIADGRSTSKTRREHESNMIDRHNPPLNKRGGGGGRYSN